MDHGPKSYWAEFLGTFTLCFIGQGAIVLNQVTGGEPGLLGIALAYGLALAVMNSALGSTSGGHFNPAVTFGFVITGLESKPVLIRAVGPTLGRAPFNAPRVGGFGIGLTVVIGVLMGGPLSGAAMNPARAFGAALISGTWGNQWIWWVGPLLGAAAAARVYKSVVLRP